MNDNNSFSSIDRLMEFGMGMAVAQQMINTMNASISQMHIPGAGSPMLPNQIKTLFYIVVNDNVAGPFDEKQLDTLAKARTLTADTLVCKQGARGWTQAKNLPEVNKILLLNP